MNETKKLKRYPAVRCWIKHIIDAAYLNEDKTFFSIFGKFKRVRLIATILDKREVLSNPSNINETDSNEDLEIEDDSNLRIEFDLDDGTGQIRAVIFGADPEIYKDLFTGDIVDIIGLLRRWKSYFIKKCGNY